MCFCTITSVKAKWNTQKSSNFSNYSVKTTKSFRITRPKGNYFQPLFITSQDHERETSNFLEDEKVVSTLPSISFPALHQGHTYRLGRWEKKLRIHMSHLLHSFFVPQINVSLPLKGNLSTEKNEQPKSWELCFIRQTKLRT